VVRRIEMHECIVPTESQAARCCDAASIGSDNAGDGIVLFFYSHSTCSLRRFILTMSKLFMDVWEDNRTWMLNGSMMASRLPLPTLYNSMVGVRV